MHPRAAPRPPVGRDGDHRPPPGHRRPRAGRPHLAGRGDRAWSDTGGPFDCDCLLRRAAQVRRPLSALRQVLSLLADDRARRADGHLPASTSSATRSCCTPKAPGCYDPMPLGPQPRPPVLPAQREFENREGCFYVADVYRGTHMKGVEPRHGQDAPGGRVAREAALVALGLVRPGLHRPPA